jgi:hypothetical protein
MKSSKAVFILLTLFVFSKAYAQNPTVSDLIYQEYEEVIDMKN